MYRDVLIDISAYKALNQRLSHHHYVYQDVTKYCRMGHVRYLMNLATTGTVPISREFASDVCLLPAIYNEAAYMKFIDDWGTVRTMTGIVGVGGI